MIVAIVIFVLIWCTLGLIPWFWIVNNQGYIGGDDIFMFTFLALLGPVSMFCYWLVNGDPIHIELPWRKK